MPSDHRKIFLKPFGTLEVAQKSGYGINLILTFSTQKREYGFFYHFLGFGELRLSNYNYLCL